MAKGDTKTNQYLDIAANGTRADLPTDTCCETRSQTLIREVAERIIIEEETRAREDQILQNEIDEIKNNPDVADIVPTYAALQDYDTSKLTDQDIIRVLADETHEGASTYYRWSTSSQTFTYVGETGDYYTKNQVNDLLDNKQDLLTAGDGITIAEESGALVISSTGGGGGTSNFNQLTNRPKYNSTTMTGSTNIPKVPTATSELTNDSGFITSSALPTVNDATLTITQNGTSKGTFTANDADDTTIALTDTTYSAGTGLDLTGTTFSADTTVLATKTDLDSKQDELTAGDNVTIEDESGALVISATDTTYSNFTGTDGTAAGVAGLVPAPATTDAGKFLKADGTWDTAGGGGGITELTSADYNWPTNNPDGVAAWNLTDGYYKSASTVKIYASSTRALSTSASKKLLISSTSSAKTIYSFGGNGSLEATVTVIDNGSETSHYTYKNPNIVQTTGSSTTDVMSQDAVTSMVFADPSTGSKIRIGSDASASGDGSVAIGGGAGLGSQASGTKSVAIGSAVVSGASSVGIGDIARSYQMSNGYGVSIGSGAKVGSAGPYSVAIGANSQVSAQGEFAISGPDLGTNGYNSSRYRLLTGLYDGQSAHDAVTVGQITPLTDSTAPTTATVGRLGQIQIDTTTATAYMCVAVDTVTPAYTWKQITA